MVKCEVDEAERLAIHVRTDLMGEILLIAYEMQPSTNPQLLCAIIMLGAIVSANGGTNMFSVEPLHTCQQCKILWTLKNKIYF